MRERVLRRWRRECKKKGKEVWINFRETRTEFKDSWKEEILRVVGR